MAGKTQYVVIPYEMLVFAVVAALVLFSAACRGLGSATHDDVVKSGIKNIPEAAQINHVLTNFPVHNKIAHFGFDKAKPTRWQTVVYLHDRYTLIYAINIHIDYRLGEVTRSVGSSDFFLMETVTVDRNGGQDIGEQWRFDSNAWKKVYAAGGDFSAIGIVLKTNAPVPNWSKATSFK